MLLIQASIVVFPDHTHFFSHGETSSMFSKRVQDKSAQNQLGPHKTRPKTTRPKVQNSTQDNSAQCKIQKKTTRPTFFEGLRHVITWKMRPYVMLHAFVRTKLASSDKVMLHDKGTC